MTFVLAIFAGAFGGLAGAIIGFFAIVLIAPLFGIYDPNGGVEMGAALTGGPLGAVIGSVASASWVVRRRRGQNGIARQGWVALGTVATVLVGLWLWLFYEPPLPSFARPEPILDVEIRLAADLVNPPDFMDFVTRLRTLNTSLYPMDRMAQRVEGDEIILSASHRMAYKIKERQIELNLDHDVLLIFELDLAENPEMKQSFSDWKRVNHVKAHYYGEDLNGPHDIFIRTRVRPGS